MASGCEKTAFVRSIETGFIHRDLSLLSIFSSTLLSTNRLNKLFHLALSALVHPDNGLFTNAMLFLHNERTETLQGMLGVATPDAGGLKVVGSDPGNPLTGHWDIEDAAIERQWQSEYCTSVRKIRIDLAGGCKLLARIMEHQGVCHIENTRCMECDECGFIRDLSINSLAVAPLLARDRKLGIVIVHNRDDSPGISGEQLHILQLFSSQAGMAIENSQLYKRLEEAHKELQESRQRILHSAHLAAVGEMAASISHELKTPLVTIGGFAARLGRMIPEDHPQRHYLDTIISESHRLEKLLADILAYSRKPTICYIRCSIHSILKECIDDYSTTFEDKGIKLNLDMPEGCWDIMADPHQIKQIFINLVVNAQEAMKEGGILDVSLSYSVDEDQDLAVITVADTGGGMPDDVLSKIYTPFFTTKRNGTGLGLPIVNRIIHNHGGRMKAANSDKGAVFNVYLPLAGSEEP